LAFVELRRHVTPGTGECVVEPVGTNVVPPHFQLAAPLVFIGEAVEDQWLPRVEGMAVHLEQAG
jgi:hypothetical protein